MLLLQISHDNNAFIETFNKVTDLLKLTLSKKQYVRTVTYLPCELKQYYQIFITGKFIFNFALIEMSGQDKTSQTIYLFVCSLSRTLTILIHFASSKIRKTDCF